jgi:hypothetical protein
MAGYDLTEIQRRINAIAGQSTDVTEGDEDWSLRSSFINRSQLDWSERFDWPQLYKEVVSATSTSTGTATISLPADFRKLANPPTLGTDTYTEVDPQNKSLYSTPDKYLYIGGNPSEGYNLIHNGTLVSGASISFAYYRSAPSLVSGSDVSLCPNPDYLVQQSLYYYFLANEDARFEISRANAEQILANLLEFENVKGTGYNNSVKSVDENFKWGRD